MLFSYCLFLITVMAKFWFEYPWDMPPFGPCQTKPKRKKKKGGELPTMQKNGCKNPQKVTHSWKDCCILSVCVSQKNKNAETASVEAYRSIKDWGHSTARLSNQPYWELCKSWKALDVRYNKSHQKPPLSKKNCTSWEITNTYSRMSEFQVSDVLARISVSLFPQKIFPQLLILNAMIPEKVSHKQQWC